MPNLNVAVMMPTYNRPQLFHRAVASLHAAAAAAHMKLDLFVVQDSIHEDYGEDADPAGYHQQANRGREYYWATVNRLFRMVRAADTLSPYARVLMFADDMVVRPDGLVDAERLHSLHCSPVSLHRCNRNNQWGMHAGEWVFGARRIGWVDGVFYGTPALLEALKWHIMPISVRRWDANPTLGSGVWQQASLRWRNKGIHFVQPKQSIVTHDDKGVSQMNPLAENRGVETKT